MRANPQKGISRQPVRYRRDRNEPAEASDFIRHLGTLRRKQKIRFAVLYCRVSGRTQNRKGNLDDQVDNLGRWLDRYGIRRIETFREVASGWESDRERLGAAIELARENDAIIVAETTDRLIRNVNYHSRSKRDALPTQSEFEELRRLANGVIMTTLLVPDADPEIVRWYQQDRGQRAKGNCGGRPKQEKPGYKKQRRTESLSMVLQLHNEGLSSREILKIVKIPRMTIQDWIRRNKGGN